MKFVVNSRHAMINAQPPEEAWALISICEKGDFPSVHENDHMKGRLNLQFHDSDGNTLFLPEDGKGLIFFDENHARQVLDFYEAMDKEGVSVMYVHCLMGQARSAAVAAALEKALNGDDSKYFSNGFYKPNMLVFRGVLNECHERGLI